MSTEPSSSLGGPLTAADVMTAAEVAALLRAPRSTVEHWARRGIVPSKKVGRRRIYVRSRIEALLLEDDADPHQQPKSVKTLTLPLSSKADSSTRARCKHTR